jgi:transposase-like protein
LVADQPGITVSQAAKQFGLKEASGLYAIARGLQADGLVRKSGTELHPTATTEQN